MEIQILNLFGRDREGEQGPDQNEGPSEVTSRLDTALTTIFNEDGKRTVLYYMTNKFNLSLQQASADPTKLEGVASCCIRVRQGPEYTLLVQAAVGLTNKDRRTILIAFLGTQRDSGHGGL
jgi:hypothetical protein